VSVGEPKSGGTLCADRQKEVDRGTLEQRRERVRRGDERSLRRSVVLRGAEEALCRPRPVTQFAAAENPCVRAEGAVVVKAHDERGAARSFDRQERVDEPVVSVN